MKPYRYFKTLAKLGLAGSFIKSIVVFSIVTLLPQLLLLLPTKFDFKGYQILIAMGVTYFLLIPCFKMGAIGFVYDSIFKKKPSMGNVFDGFKYILKLIPLIIARLLPLIPFFVTGYIVFANIDPKTIEILREYSVSPMENMDMLLAISDKDFNLMFWFEAGLFFTILLCLITIPLLALTEYILYDEKLPSFKAIIKSIKLMKGHTLYYIGFNLSFIFWHLASTITMGFSTLVLNPYKEASFILFYNYLRFKNGEIETPETIKENTENQNEEE